MTVIALFSTAWGVLNSLFSPVVFQMFGLPILCDMIGFACLSVTVWWVMKLGSATLVGFIATLICFLFNPSGLFILGFSASAIIFDAIAWIIGYGRSFESVGRTTLAMTVNSVLSAGIAGLIIGAFFMPAPALVAWGGIIGWAGLHAVGGLIAGLIGVALIATLSTRGIKRLT